MVFPSRGERVWAKAAVTTAQATPLDRATGTRLGRLCRSLGMQQRGSRDRHHCRVHRRRSGLDRHSPRRRYRVIPATTGELESSRVDQTPRCAPGSGGGHEHYSRVGVGSGLACRHRTHTRGYSLLSFRLARESKAARDCQHEVRKGLHTTHRSIRRAASPEPWRRSSLQSSSSAESSPSS